MWKADAGDAAAKYTSCALAGPLEYSAMRFTRAIIAFQSHNRQTASPSWHALAIAGLVCSWINVTFATASPRNRTAFDYGWKFHLGELQDAQSQDYNDDDWRELDLPHDWSLDLPFDPNGASGTGYLPGGVGWYRKTFLVPQKWRGREVFIQFDGIQRDCDVWINGEHVGHRPYGYVSFEYRLTPHLRYGVENTIAVRAERENIADSRWYPGSGIYRHTWLTVTDPIRIDHWGVFITTPRVTEERADVTASTKVINGAGAAAQLRIVSEIVDPAGKSLSQQSTEAMLPVGTGREFAHWHVVSKPNRWSTDTPVLYTMVTSIYQGEQLLDQLRTPFGIRTFHFDADAGFFVNGKPTRIKGLCLHHDGGVVGAAVPDRTLERRLKLVKAMGANAVRCSHNPMAPEFYASCDRIGLLVMDEAFDEWELGKRKWVQGRNVGKAGRFGYNKDFEQWAVRDIESMVLRDRNHPSVILWSLGNEIDYPGDPYDHPEHFDPAAPPVDEGSPSVTRLPVVAPRLIAAVKRYDPTRPVTMALSNLPASNDVGLANMLDVVGYNYQEQFYQQDHREFPGRIIYGSENSSSPRSWQHVRDNDFISGLFLWSGFDFLGEAGEWPNHGSRSGVFDTRGSLKFSGWMYQALWRDEPLVHVFVSPLRRDGRGRAGRRRFGFPRLGRSWTAASNSEVLIAVVSNCDTVRVQLDGKPINTDWSERGGLLTARIPYQPGELKIEGLDGEQIIASDSIKTPGAPARIELVVDRTEILADGQDVAHIEVRVVDNQGTLVSNNSAPITVQVAGAGRLLGLDNGNQDDPTPLSSPTKAAQDGWLLAIVQSTREAGKIEVIALGDGLEPCKRELATQGL